MSSPSSLRAVFRVRLAREYHVGAGHGSGTDVDSALFLEYAGNEAVPAVRYAHGFLRQAAYELTALPPLEAWQLCGRSRPAAGFDPDDYCGHAAHPVGAEPDEKPPCPVCRIFGSPAHPSPWSFSTMRPVAPSAAPEHPAVARSRVASRASIDPVTRRAADGKLFSQELGAPLEFEFTAERAGGGGEALDELAFLVAAARCVPGIGAGRRRGRGECSVELRSCEGMQVDAASLLERFDASWLAKGPGEWRRRTGRPHVFPRDVDAPASVPWYGAAAESGWEELRLVARAEEPLVMGVQPLAGNLLESEFFVPGTLLLGAVAGRVASAAPGEDDFLRVFRGGSVLFPDLLPAYEEEVGAFRPGFPAPLDLRTCPLHPGPKHAGGHGVWSLSLSMGSAPPRACPECRGQGREDVKLGRLGPLLLDGGSRLAWKPEAGEETKIAVHPRTGRVQEESLYHRETIPTGTLLSGVLRARPGALEWLREQGLFTSAGGETELRVGKRHGRGYGRLRLAWWPVSAEEAAAERERTRARVRRLVKDGLPVPVVLASRLLLRDGFGRVRQSLAPVDLGLDGEGSCTVGWGTIGGFWRHIGMPRRRDAVLLPGSVLHLRPAGGGSEEWTERLLGLADGTPPGERTAEGLGRLAVAPFPYGWLGDGDVEDAPPPLPVPAGLRRARLAPAAGAVPPADPGEGHFRRYALKLRGAGLPLQDYPDEWQAVARVLYTRAGDPAGDLVRRLEQGGGDPAGALDEVGPARERKSFFLGEGKGVKPWAALRVLVEDAAGPALGEGARALRTRALAEAVADRAAPGKGVHSTEPGEETQ